MKNIISILMLLLFLSCASIKLENKIVNDFIKEQYVSEKYCKNIIIVEEKISSFKALEIYENAFNDKEENLYTSRKLKSLDNSYENKEWQIDALEIKKLKTNLLDELKEEFWDENDFYEIKFPIMKFKKIRDNHFSDNYINDSRLAYQISKPILSMNKRYALIYIYSFNIGLGETQIRGVYLLRKIKKNWVRETLFIQDVYK